MDADRRELTFALQGLGYSYRTSPCLAAVDLNLERGRMYGLIGPNGSGKTTLINLLTGTAAPTTGTIRLYGQPMHAYAKSSLARLLSFVPQSFSMDFDYSVQEVVMMGRHPYIGRFGSPSRADQEAVDAALATLDIGHLRDRFVTRLSGGERQRVLVARALAQDTGIMILDEATASLDVRHSIDIMQALRTRVVRHGATVIAAIHDLELAAAFCDEMLILQAGKLHAAGPVQHLLTTELLQEVFGVDAVIQQPADQPPHIRYCYNHV